MTHVNKHYIITCIFFVLFLFSVISGTVGPQCVPGALRSPKYRDHPEQRQSHSSDDEQKWQLRKWWAHTLDRWHLSIWNVSQHQARGVCVLTLGATQCAHTICLSAFALLYTSSVRELHLHCSIQRTLFMSLFTSASTCSIMAEREPLIWFSDATNVFLLQKIWPWIFRTDATASKWARLAYGVLCLTPTAV